MREFAEWKLGILPDSVDGLPGRLDVSVMKKTSKMLSAETALEGYLLTQARKARAPNQKE